MKEKLQMTKKMFIMFLGCLLLISCATVSEKYKNPVEEAAVNRDQYAKVTLYNDTNFILYPSSDIVGIEIIFDGKHAANLRHGQYIDLYVKKGGHSLTLTHWDMFKFTDTYDIELTNDNYIMQLYCQPISTAYELKNRAPEGLDKATESIKN